MIKNYDLTHDAAARERVARPSDEIEQLIQAALALEVEALADEEVTTAKNLVDSAMNALAAACSSIQSQIDEANLRREQDGEFSDPDWYRRVHGAGRAKRWQRQLLQNKLGEINRRVRKGNAIQHDSRREKLFIDIARLHLPRETFTRLWELVEETERMK